MSPGKSKAWEWHKGALKNLGKCIFFMNCIIGSETSPMMWSVCLFVIRLVGLSVCHNFVKSSTNCPKMYTYANILWNFSYTYLGLTNLENGSNQLLWRWGRSMDGLKKDLSTTEPLATLLFFQQYLSLQRNGESLPMLAALYVTCTTSTDDFWQIKIGCIG